MEVEGFREGEEGLQDAVDVGGWEEIVATGDVGDLLIGIVHDDGEVIGCADVLACEDDVSEQVRVDGVGAVDEVGKGERAGGLGGERGIEPP